MQDFCLLHYLLSSDSEAMILYKSHYSIQCFLETFNKKTRLVLYWIILNGNTSRFGSAIQVLPSDIGRGYFRLKLSPTSRHCPWWLIFFNSLFYSPLNLEKRLPAKKCSHMSKLWWQNINYNSKNMLSCIRLTKAKLDWLVGKTGVCIAT